MPQVPRPADSLSSVKVGSEVTRQMRALCQPLQGLRVGGGRPGVRAGSNTKGLLTPGLWEPLVFWHLWKGLVKEGSCKSHSSQWAWTAVIRMYPDPQSPTPTSDEAATHHRPHFPFWFVSLGTWYTLLRCFWEECLLYPLPSLFYRLSVSVFKLKSYGSSQNIEFMIQKQYSFNNIVFPPHFTS